MNNDYLHPSLVITNMQENNEQLIYDKGGIKAPKTDLSQSSKASYVTLEELEPLLSESGYLCLGHGTGRVGDSDNVVTAIFKEGLRTKDNSLYLTTIGLSTPTPEIKRQAQELGISEPSIDSLKELFNHWPHQNSKQIIIARIPTKYINTIGDIGDLDGERYGAFMRSCVSNDGKLTNYLNPRFILGCFDVEKQMIKLNPQFERQLSDETIVELSAKYIEALEKTKTRIKGTMASLTSKDTSSSFHGPENVTFSSDWDSFETNSFNDDTGQNSMGK